MINVPIPKEKILETVASFPRTPDQAGLVAIEIKRKKNKWGYKKPTIARPDLLIKWLDELKRQKNPFYQDVNIGTEAEFRARCLLEDRDGYREVFDELVPENDAVEEDPEEGVSTYIDNNLQDEFFPEDSDSDSDEEKEDDERKEEAEKERQRDPIKKHQIGYDRSSLMTERDPEMTRQLFDNTISVAPGEGQTPTDVLYEKGWDLKAYPHLNNLDGTCGLHEEREVKLTHQKFLANRLSNMDKRFARHPPFIFSCATYIEAFQIRRNMGLSYTHGHAVNQPGGTVKFEGHDAYAVLDDIKNTPRFWKKKKNELLARLDNLGPFQWFFTLSCADKRWAATMISVIRERDDVKKVETILIEGEDGFVTAKTFVTTTTDEMPVDLDVFKDRLDTSYHEIIRQNVLEATRYFDHRVKAFITEKVRDTDAHIRPILMYIPF